MPRRAIRRASTVGAERVRDHGFAHRAKLTNDLGIVDRTSQTGDAAVHGRGEPLLFGAVAAAPGDLGEQRVGPPENGRILDLLCYPKGLA